MTDQKRPYRMKRRAELEEQTRLRITESAVELHGTVGPARTSVTAVAERAGVRRSTVYRHFPDEDALFEACSRHWMAANQPPDLTRWSAIEDPDERLERGLRELYGYYRATEPMMANILRDAPAMPVVDRNLGAYRGFLAAALEVLMTGRRSRRPTRAAIGHALAFPTWRSLAREQELTDAEAAQLMCRLVAAA
jgi:AcrR family transcriptional regulator